MKCLSTYGWQWGAEARGVPHFSWRILGAAWLARYMVKANRELLDPCTSLGQSCICGRVQGWVGIWNACILSHRGHEEPSPELLLMARSVPVFVALLWEL